MNAVSIPDYVRCGSMLYYVTWTRLVMVCLAVLLGVVALSEVQEHLPVESDLVRDEGVGLRAAPRDPASAAAPRGSNLRSSARGAADSALSSLLGRAAGRLSAGHGASKRSGARKAAAGGGARASGAPLPSLMPTWCASQPSQYYLDKWHLTYLGSSSELPDADAGDAHVADAGAEGGKAARLAAAPAGNRDAKGELLCDWVPLAAIKAEFPFAVCTFDRETDTQISAHIHREGVWNAGKRDLLESVLPRVNEMMELPDRNMVVDVGANLGFYTLLAAARGYDTVSLEPSVSTAHRLLHSLKANGIKTARSGSDRGVNSGHTRMPVAYVYTNAAGDSYNAQALRFIADNPGASWVDPDGRGTPVTMVFLDDLLDAKTRDPQGGPHPGAAGTIVPSRVRLLKISAEGWDARALHGARRLLSLGRVPYVHLVFNADHILSRNCDPRALILALFEAGYRMYHGSVFIYREKELNSFLAGMGMVPGSGEGAARTQARSMEIFFIRHDAPFEPR